MGRVFCRHGYSSEFPPRGFGEERNMANLNLGNRGTGEQCQNILGNRETKTIESNFGDQKVGDKFESNLGNKPHAW